MQVGRKVSHLAILGGQKTVTEDPGDTPDR